MDGDRTKSDYNIQKQRTLFLELRVRDEKKLTYKTFHVGCAIINSGLILGGQNLSNRLTVFFVPIDPRDRSQGS